MLRVPAAAANCDDARAGGDNGIGGRPDPGDGAGYGDAVVRMCN